MSKSVGHLAIFLLLMVSGCVAAATAQTAGTAHPASATEAMYAASADSAERKFRHIQENGQRPQPDQSPTQLTEREINAYFAAGRVSLPKGVQRVQFFGSQAVVTGTARVDFDQITAGKSSMNPLLALFRGLHDITVQAHARGAGHQGRVHIDSAAIDGVNVPRVALELFVSKYVTPKYPNVGMDSTFRLPERIDTAVVGDHLLTVTQK
jgi:hypothetical protein